MRAELDAVLFDLDGVVTDTAAAHASAWKQVFDAFLKRRADQQGAPFVAFDPEGDYHTFVDGKRRVDGVESFLRSRGIELERGQPDDPPSFESMHGIGNTKAAQFLRWIDENGVEAFAGTVSLLEQLREAAVPVGIFSASRNCRQVLEAAGAADYFDVRVDGVDAARLDLEGKPAPAMLLEAARRLGVDPGRCAVFEDALAGVEAGERGGFALVIGVDRGSGAAALLAAGADTVVADVGEVEPEALGNGRVALVTPGPSR